MCGCWWSSSSPRSVASIGEGWQGGIPGLAGERGDLSAAVAVSGDLPATDGVSLSPVLEGDPGKIPIRPNGGLTAPSRLGGKPGRRGTPGRCGAIRRIGARALVAASRGYGILRFSARFGGGFHAPAGGLGCDWGDAGFGGGLGHGRNGSSAEGSLPRYSGNRSGGRDDRGERPAGLSSPGQPVGHRVAGRVVQALSQRQADKKILYQQGFVFRWGGYQPVPGTRFGGPGRPTQGQFGVPANCCLFD